MAARRSSHRRGLRAELLAALWLRLKGYRILARRYRSPVGEIDLVIARGRQVAAVEVKLRGDRDSAAAAIPPGQWQRIARALEMWRQDNPAFQAHDLRFDAMLMAPGRLPRHLPNALWLEEGEGR